MPRKTKEEIKEWVEDKKRKKGDKLVTEDEPTGSDSVRSIKIELEKL